MLWVIFSILAALCWAIVNTVDKYIITKWVKTPIVPLVVMGFIDIIVAVLIFALKGFSELSYFYILLTLLAGGIYVGASFVYFKAIKKDEISRLVPLYQLEPLFVLLLATIFLGEFFIPLKYLGIFLLVAGSFLISYRPSKGIKFGRSIKFMIFAVFIFAVNAVFIKYLLNFADYWTIFSYARIGSFLALVPVIYFSIPELKETVRKHGKKTLAIMSANSVLNVLGVFFITIAASLGFITLVRALTSLQPFFVLLFAIILSIFFPKILKEDINKKTIVLKVIAIILLIAGALIIVSK